MLPCTVGHAMPGDRHQPGYERPTGVICRPSLMQGQQSVLHEILDILPLQGPQPLWDPVPQDCSRFVEQRSVGFAVPVLGRSHQAG